MRDVTALASSQQNGDGASSQGKPVRRTGRLDFVDATRGFAALAVLVAHSLQFVFPSIRNGSLPFVNLGEMGVVAFFLVSGFIIPVSMERAGSLKAFWISRIFRLFPMYWVSLAIALLLAWTDLLPLLPAFAAHRTRDVLLNVTMLQQFVNVPNVVGVYWTLSLELIFYALCSILFFKSWLSRSLLWAWVFVSFMAVSVMVAGFVFHGSLPAGRIGMLVTAFFGTVLYRIYSKQLRASVVSLLLPALALTLLVGFWFRFHLYPAVRSAENSMSVTNVSISWALAYGLFAMLFLMRNRAFPRWTLWLGRISYSLYLLHGLVLTLVPHSWNPFLYIAVSWTISLGLSTLTYSFIEKPAIAFCRRHFLPLLA